LKIRDKPEQVIEFSKPKPIKIAPPLPYPTVASRAKKRDAEKHTEQ
jgi:hypothetical protein